MVMMSEMLEYNWSSHNFLFKSVNRRMSWHRVSTQFSQVEQRRSPAKTREYKKLKFECVLKVRLNFCKLEINQLVMSWNGWQTMKKNIFDLSKYSRTNRIERKARSFDMHFVCENKFQIHTHTTVDWLRLVLGQDTTHTHTLTPTNRHHTHIPYTHINRLRVHLESVLHRHFRSKVRPRAEQCCTHIHNSS